MSGRVVSRNDGQSPRCELRPSFRPDGRAVQSDLERHKIDHDVTTRPEMTVPGRIVASARDRGWRRGQAQTADPKVTRRELSGAPRPTFSRRCLYAGFQGPRRLFPLSAALAFHA